MARSPDQRLPPSRGPFSRLLRIREVPDAGLSRTVDATPAECAAIAADLGFPALASLHADLHVAARAGGRFDVSGRVSASVTQVCVVSLEPFESVLGQDVAISFAQPAPAQASSRAQTLDVDLDVLADEPDPIIDGTIDLGAVALEFLVLACDPYPKKPGVHFKDTSVGEEEEEPSPFAALGRLKDQT